MSRETLQSLTSGSASNLLPIVVLTSIALHGLPTGEQCVEVNGTAHQEAGEEKPSKRQSLS
jgi:hypothetical protein